MDWQPFSAATLSERLLVVHDSLAFDGGFMHPLLLKIALQAGHGVVLLAVQQTRSHYQQVLRKLGVNLAACEQSGQLTVVDLLNLAGGSTGDADDFAAGCPRLLGRLVDAVATAAQRQEPASGKSDAQAADGVAASAAAHVQQPPLSRGGGSGGDSGDSGPVVNVFIDDLTTVGGLISDTPLWCGFLQQLLDLCRQQPHPASLVATLHSDVTTDAGAAELMSAAANVLVDIEPLTAGRSHDVSGAVSMQLQGCRHDLPWGVGGGNGERRFFFQATDRGVRFLQRYTAS